jgi:signal transduction histidine kinase
MPARALGRHFARRMLPLAAVAGLVVAVAPPVSYRLVAWEKLAEQAGIYARHLAAGLQAVAERQPRLWRYNAAKVYHATAAHRRLRDIGAVRIVACDGRTLFAPRGLGVGTGTADGPARRAAVVARGRTVAFVAVTMDASAARRTLLGIAVRSGVLGLGIGLLLFFFPTRVVRRQARELAEAMRRLEAAEADLTAANRGLAERVAAEVREVRRLSERVVRIQEEERGRIARDLHDGVGQALTGLQMGIEQALADPAAAGRHLEEATRMCRDTLAEVRRVVHDLRPPEFGADDAVEILRAYAERFEERTGIAAPFRAVGGPPGDGESAVCLFRVLQEALTNVSRHAEAREVGISLEAGPQEVRLEVVDDGKGFDVSRAGAGAGLRGIRERCAFLGGSAEVSSSPGAGTRVVVRLPVRGGGS